MTDQSIIESKLATAKSRLQAATIALTKNEAAVQSLRAQAEGIGEQLRDDPKLPQSMHQQHAALKSQLYRLTGDQNGARSELEGAQRDLARLQMLAGGDEALQQVQQAWREKSAAQVAAAKIAEDARDELVRLDATIAEESAKVEAAQKAQSSAILARLGFSKKPAGEVEDAESVLVGSAGIVHALRAARPDLEAVVVEADAKVALCDKATRDAAQAILNVKQVLAEGAMLLALEACRAAAAKYHIATIAATGGFGERLTIYTQQDSAEWEQQQADQLRALAAVGE